MAFVHSRQLATIADAVGMDVPEGAMRAAMLDMIAATAPSDIITLSPRRNLCIDNPLKITVFLPSDEAMTVVVWPRMQVAALKRMIWDKGGCVPADNQRLIFLVHDVNDRAELREYGVASGDAMVVLPRHRSSAATSSEAAPSAAAPPPPPPAPPSAPGSGDSLPGLPGETQVIVQSISTGENTPVVVNPAYVVPVLKALVSAKTGIDPQDQRLVYKLRIMEDNHTIQEHGVPDHGFIYMFTGKTVSA